MKRVLSFLLLPFVSPGLPSAFFFLLCVGAISANAQSVERGHEANMATMNFKALADYELLHPVPVVQQEKKNRFFEIPRNRPVDSVSLSERRRIPGGPTSFGPVGITPPLPFSPAPTDTFQSTLDVFGTIPPDTHGAVDSNYCVTAINTTVKIQTKSGGSVSSVSLNTFFSSVNASLTNVFDPRVHYDPYANRWILIAVSGANNTSDSTSILIGISQTSNPTGSWWLYRVRAYTPHTYWLDYPDVGFNGKWITVTGNLFENSPGTGYGGAKVFMFNKANLLAGTGASFTAFTQTGSFTICPSINYHATNPNLFAVESWNGAFGAMKMWKFTGNVGSESMTSVGLIFSPNDWWYGSNAFSGTYGADFAPQASTSNKVQTNDDRVTQLIFMNGKLWFSHTVFMPYSSSANPTRSSVQWWQTDTTTASPTQVGLIDDATNTNFYAFPSIAVNTANDALIGFSRFSASTYPSAAYAMRFHSDVTDSTRPVVVFRNGLASYFKTFGGGKNRWGDYSGTCLDPANNTNFWTIQEASSTPSSGADRWDTWWAHVAPPCNTPGSITGTATVCVGSTTTLSCTPSGGTWSSSSTSVATVGTSGIVTGAGGGTATITYSTGTGCTSTRVVTVNILPASITGTATVCVGSTTTLSSGTSGGTWSTSSGSIATVGTSGIVTGAGPGTATITYTLSTGCLTTRDVTVNTTPSAISGTLAVCTGTSTTLTSSPTGGTWSSVTTAVGTIGSSSGVATGLSAGTTTISYALSTGCTTSAVLTVNTTPSAISGTATVCEGSTTTLSSTPTGGTWTSSAGSIASVGTSGVVTGASAGSAIITYTLSGGCFATRTVTVNAAPATIGGAGTVCSGLTTTLTNGVSGGTWSSSNTAQATVGSSSGVVTGVAAGCPTLTYTLSNGCFATHTLCVLTSPAFISGSSTVCVGSSTTLGNSVSGGTWTSSSTSVAGVGSSSGIVTGSSAGTATITYTLSSGCFSVHPMTVNAAPATIGGAASICNGTATTLTNSVTGGTWTSSNPSIAVISTSSGIVSGVSPGCLTITYTLSNGCFTTHAFCVLAQPGAITGTPVVCEGATTTLGNSVSGGTWTSNTPSVASVGTSSGVVSGNSAGTATITYTLSTGCFSTQVVTVNASPAAIAGPTSICVGTTGTLTDATTGGVWTSSNVTFATVGSASGIVTGVAVGCPTITYTISSGCFATYNVCIIAAPAAITGTATVCAGSITTLSSATTGGTWTSGTVGVATVGSSTGDVTGNSIGTATITYTLSGGCFTTREVTVTTAPGSITGTTTVCEGSTTTLSCSPTGGAWSSSATGVATVGSSSGIVSGAGAGTATITYSLGASCFVTTPVTVNTTPSALSGASTVCLGATTTLSSSPTGGSWSSSSSSVASVGTSGVVTGAGAGTATITYSLATGCFATKNMTVNSLPSAITGTLNVCVGATTTLGSTPSGGTWTSGATGVATVGSSSGIVSGAGAGTATIAYTLPTTCNVTAVVTVNTTPSAITGTATLCVGATTTLSSTPSGGTWTSGSTGIATVGSSSGIVTGVDAGTANITYSLSGSCIAVITVTVSGVPTITSVSPLSGMPGSSVLITGTNFNSTLSSNIVYFGTTRAALVAGSTTSLNVTVPVGATHMYVTVDNSTCALTGYHRYPFLPTYNNVPFISTLVNFDPLADFAAGTAPYGVAVGDLDGDGWTDMVVSNYSSSNITVYRNTGFPGPGAIISGSFASGVNFATNANPAGITVGDVDGDGKQDIIVSNDSYVSVFRNTATSGSITTGSFATRVDFNAGAFCNWVAAGDLDGDGKLDLAAIHNTPFGVSVLRNTSTSGSITTGSFATAFDLGLTTYSNVSVGDIDGNGKPEIYGTNGPTMLYVFPNIATPGSLNTGSFGSRVDFTTSGADRATLADIDGDGKPDVVVSNNSSNSFSVFRNVSTSGTINTGSLSSAVSFTTGSSPAGLAIGDFNGDGKADVAVGNSGSNSISVFRNTATSGTLSSGSFAAKVDFTTGSSPQNVAVGDMDGDLKPDLITAASSDNTVNVLRNSPFSPIYGPLLICPGTSHWLGDSAQGGAFISSDTTVATIDLYSGIVTGMAGGTTTISYTLNGVTITAVLTVNTLAPITGIPAVCVGSTTALSDATTGGTWTSSATGVATVGSSTGIVSGVGSGISTITYTLPSGCFATMDVTVNIVPTPIAGTTSICVGNTTTLSSTPTGGTWSSSNTGVATVGSGSGLVTGTGAGTANISYMLSSGCFATKTVTVNTATTPITGSLLVCIGNTTTLSCSPSGGTWTSSTPPVASVGASSGIVTGNSTGTANITYSLGAGCESSATVTVNTNPGVITGSTSICQGTSTTLGCSPAGGTWSSSNTGVAGIGSSSGLLTGVSAGSATITYLISSTGCISTRPQTIIAAPGITLGINPSVPSGSTSANLPYTSPVGIPTLYTITYGTSALLAGFTNVTSAILPPTPIVLVVPGAAPVAIYTGTLTVTNGTCTSTAYPFTVNVTGANAAPTFTGGSPQSLVVCKNSLATSIDGLLEINDIDVGNIETWSVSVAPLHGTILTGGTQLSTGGNVTPTGFAYVPTPGYSGTDLFTIQVSDGMGGFASTTIMVTVNPTPPLHTVTGGGGFCAGGTGFAILLSGSNAGMSYQLYNGVTPVGTPLTGTGTVLNFGVFTTAGVYTVIATHLGNLCTALMLGSATITANPNPNIYTVTGGGIFCAPGPGAAINLSGSDLGVTYRLYRSGTTLVGSPVAGTGGPITVGMATFADVYTVVATNPTTGCTATMSGSASVVINSIPAPVYMIGGGGYCAGGTGVLIGLAGSAMGINYQLYLGSTPVGSPVPGAGTSISFGLQTVAGTYTVIATNPITGCTSTMYGSVSVYIYPLPNVYAVSGGGNYCAGGTGETISLSSSDVGINYQLYRGGLPVVSTIIAGTGGPLTWPPQTVAGTYTIMAKNAGFSACTILMSGSAVVSIDPLPTAYTVTGGGNYCPGGTGVGIFLSSSTAGVDYQLYRGTTAVGSPVAGTGTSLNFGLVTATGIYTVKATNATTGCTGNMTGSATVGLHMVPYPFVVSGGGTYCAGGTGVPVYLSGSVTGTTYQLFRGSTPVGSPMTGTGTIVPFGLQTVAGTYTVVATNTTTGCTNNMTGSVTVNITALPTVFTVTGGGNYCSGGTGLHIYLSGSTLGVGYRLYRGATLIGSAVSGTGAALDFGLFTTTGTYTVTATITGTACVNNMAGSATIGIDPLPVAYSLTGGGGYCIGGTGVTVGLAGSQSGVNYQLFLGSTPVGSPVAGTGSGISFGLQTTAGTYTAVATDATTSCVRNMTSSATVVINTLPTTYTVTGGGGYCAGGTGVPVYLSSSQTSVTYQLFRGSTAVGSPLPGTGAALAFGLQTVAGTYTVVATRSTGCSGTMAGSATVTVNTSPTVYAVTGGGPYCAGGTGVTVGLSGSDTGVSYKLYRGTTLLGSPVPGTGSALNFGLQTVTGTYTVVATLNTGGCTANMTGFAFVTITSAPAAVLVTGGGGYCAGGTGVLIGLAGSAVGVNYQLYRGSTPIGSPLPGVGSSLSFGLQTVAGTYTVVGTYASSPCSSNMIGSATVTIYTVPSVYTVSGGGSYCSGGAGVHIYLSGSSTGVSYKIYRGSLMVGSPVPGTGGALDFGIFTATGTYTVVAVASVSGCTTAMTGSATVSIDPLPTVSGTIYTVAPGSNITFTGSIGGGTWSSVNTSIATVGASSGIITGVSLGGTIISYFLPTGCGGAHTVAVTATGFKESPDDENIITEEAVSDVKVVPNPNKGAFVIQGKLASDKDADVSLVVTDIVGKVIYRKVVQVKGGALDELIDLGEIAPGVYLLNMHSDTEQKVFHVVIGQ